MGGECFHRVNLDDQGPSYLTLIVSDLTTKLQTSELVFYCINCIRSEFMEYC